MTKPLLDNAFSLLSKYAAEYEDVLDLELGFQLPVAVLGGPRIRYVGVSSDDQIRHAKAVIKELEERYPDKESLVLIHLQYWSPHFANTGKVDPFAEALKKDEILGEYYRFAASTKGKEYFAGVVVCPDDLWLRIKAKPMLCG